MKHISFYLLCQLLAFVEIVGTNVQNEDALPILLILFGFAFVVLIKTLDNVVLVEAKKEVLLVLEKFAIHALNLIPVLSVVQKFNK